jgi:predicted membrane channel-forming protein YqfA (hemolysin III family)
MDEFAEMASREAKRIARRQSFWLHAAVFVPIQVILLILWIAVDAQFPWFAFPLLGWGMLLAVHGVYAFVMKTPEEIMIERTARAEQRSEMAAQG